MIQPLRRSATYADIEALPPTLVGEILFDELVTHPRPAPRHAVASSALGAELMGAFQHGRYGPGGWIFMDEPELHLGPHVAVPEIAGWRRETLPALPDTAWIETRPDWVCEVLSPSTEAYDRGPKRQIYAAAGVLHLWLVDPRIKLLEAFALIEGQWVLIAALRDEEGVRVPPYDAISFSLGLLWPFDPPAGSPRAVLAITAQVASMPINILMPALSPTMEKGNLAKWHVKEGDKVASGDVIAEIETDKATMEVEAVDEGTVAKILVAEGTADVPVNQLIALLAGEGEDAGSAAASAPGAGQAEAPATAPPGGGESVAGASGAQHAPVWGEKAPELAAKSEGGAGGASATPAAQAGAPSSEEPAASPAPQKANGGNGRIFASPLARRLARENKLELSALQGSGPHGRIVQRDIEAALQSGAGKQAAQPAAAAQTAPAAPAAAPAAAAQPAAAPQGMSDDVIRKLFEEGSYEVVPHDSMRKTIARRLVEAKTTIPHFYLTTDCRIDALLKLRAELNAAAPMRKMDAGEAPLYKLSVNDMVIKAMALALRAVPDANVTWTSEGMLKHRRADVGVAVSIPGGLITPVVRRADEKTLSAISNEMKSLAKRARDRKLKPEEYQGGTTAVSNLGMFGVKDFAAVINPPHATILAVGAGEERAIVEKGQIVIGNVMSATLSTDHRAVDGALGAELLAAFKGFIEKPMGMLV